MKVKVRILATVLKNVLEIDTTNDTDDQTNKEDIIEIDEMMLL